MLVHNATRNETIYSMLGLTFLLSHPQANHEHRGGFFRNPHEKDSIWEAFLGRWEGEHLTVLTSTGSHYHSTNISYEVAYCLLQCPQIRRDWLTRASDGDSPLLNELIQLGNTPNDQLLGLLHSFITPPVQRLLMLRLDNLNE